MFTSLSWLKLIIAIISFITACIKLYIHIDTKRDKSQDKKINNRH